MKIIDIRLGRETSYGGTAGRLAAPWTATIIHEDSKSKYPSETEIPEHIAVLMADAALIALIDSGHLTPTFTTGVVPLPPEPVSNLPVDKPAPPAFLQSDLVGADLGPI